MTAVLADSGPLYALAFASDQYHVQARADLERLAADRLKVMISYSTVVESHSLILRRAALEYALTWLTTIRATGEFIAPRRTITSTPSNSSNAIVISESHWQTALSQRQANGSNYQFGRTITTST